MKSKLIEVVRGLSPVFILSGEDDYEVVPDLRVQRLNPAFRSELGDEVYDKATLLWESLPWGKQLFAPELEDDDDA